MNGWTFVIAAYTLALAASAGIAVVSFFAMRAAEKKLP